MNHKRILPILFAAALLTGCGNLTPSSSLEIAVAIAANEAVLANQSNRAVLAEVETGLNVFCGQQQIDTVALYQFLRVKLGDQGRLGYVFLLFDQTGSKLTPADHVQFGQLACQLRAGIKRGLALSQ